MPFNLLPQPTAGTAVRRSASSGFATTEALYITGIKHLPVGTPIPGTSWLTEQLSMQLLQPLQPTHQPVDVALQIPRLLPKYKEKKLITTVAFSTDLLILLELGLPSNSIPTLPMVCTACFSLRGCTLITHKVWVWFFCKKGVFSPVIQATLVWRMHNRPLM